MSFFKLVFHSLSIIAVFKHQVFLRSAFLLIIFSYLSSFLDLGIIIPQILIALFCLVIFSVSLNSVDNNYEIGSKNFNSINEIAQ